MPASITVLIPTYNEEDLIEQAISSSQFANEILIIDSYSEDATVEIAKKKNCTILQRKFDNFSNQKNYAISKAKNDWILVLDADEVITYKLKNEILNAVNNPKHQAYKMLFKNYFINRFIHYGSNGNKLKLRLFNRNYCHYKGLVHEELICNGSVGILNGRILHYTYRDLIHFFQKKNQYSSLQSKQLFNKGKQASFLKLIFKPGYRFLNEYLLRLGFMDGIPGLTSTTMNGYGVLSRYVKLQVLNKQIKDSRLINYDAYTATLIKEAKEEAYASNMDKPIRFLDFFLKPLSGFFSSLIIEKQLLKGKTGYIYSYLNGFKSYNTVLYQWLRRRNLK